MEKISGKLIELSAVSTLSSGATKMNGTLEIININNVPTKVNIVFMGGMVIKAQELTLPAHIELEIELQGTNYENRTTGKTVITNKLRAFELRIIEKVYPVSDFNFEGKVTEIGEFRVFDSGATSNNFIVQRNGGSPAYASCTVGAMGKVAETVRSLREGTQVKVCCKLQGSEFISNGVVRISNKLTAVSIEPVAESIVNVDSITQ